MKSVILLTGIVGLLLWVCCSKDKGNNPQPSSENKLSYINCRISAQGGTYPIDTEFVMTVPPGAVLGDTTVAVAKLDTQTMQAVFADYGEADFPVVAGFDIKPAGLTFAKPITFTFKSLTPRTPYVPLTHTVDITSQTHCIDSCITMVDDINDSLCISVVRSGGYIVEPLTNWPGGLTKTSTIVGCKDDIVEVTASQKDVQCTDQDCQALESIITVQFKSCAGEPIDTLIDRENVGKCTGTLTLTPDSSTISCNSFTMISALVRVGCVSVKGQTITLGVSGPAGVKISPVNIQTDSNGKASTTLNSGNAAGTAVITANATVKYPVREFIISGFSGSEEDSLYRIVQLDTQISIIVKKIPCGGGMRHIQGGTFQMGSTKGSTETVHSVTVSSYYMDTTEVTQADYLSLMGVNPSSITGDLTRPVETVTWYDAVIYCNARSKCAGLDTVYSGTSATFDDSNHCISISGLTADFSKNGYRLPTEAEWEYACRAGTTTDYYWSTNYPPSTTADTAAIDNNAEWVYNSNSSTESVGKKMPNAWGLYDMAGNVAEWCWDWCDYYSSNSQTDPTGPSTGTYRVVRGGSWFDDYGNSLITLTSWYQGEEFTPDCRLGYLGFRCVRR